MNRQTIGLTFVILVALGLTAKFLLGPNPDRGARSGRELATRVLGEYLARHFSGKRALVLTNPYADRPGTERHIREMEEAGLRGLREGLGGALVIGAVVQPELRPEARENPRAVPIDPQTTTPLSFLVARDAFDQAARAHLDCEIIVSLIGLPAELGACESWTSRGSPNFALLLPDLRMVGGTGKVVAAVKSGKLVAFVLRKPGGVEDDAAMGENPQEEFDRRFVLVNRDTIDRLLQEYPGLF